MANNAAAPAADADSPNTIMFNNLRRAINRFRQSDSRINGMCDVLFPDEHENNIDDFINVSMHDFNDVVNRYIQNEKNAQAQLKIIQDLEMELKNRPTVTVRTHSHLLLALQYTSPSCIIHVVPRIEERDRMLAEVLRHPHNHFDIPVNNNNN